MLSSKEEKQLMVRLEKIEAEILALTKKVQTLNLIINTVSAEVIEFHTFIDGRLERIQKMFLQATQQLPLVVKFKDKAGKDAKVDGLPSWALSDPSLASLVVAADGMSATLVPSGALGAMKVQVSADADLGEGVKSILGELDVEILAGEAVAVEISAGAPSDIEVAPAPAPAEEAAPVV